jgi:hypothetical protein
MDPLLTDLRRIRRRLRTVRALEAAMAGAAVGAAVAAVVTFVRIVLPQAMPTVAAWPILAMLAIPLGFLAALLGRLAAGPTLIAAARAADRAAGLKECLATACEVLASDSRGLLDDRLLAEARAVAARLDVRRLPLATTLVRRSRIALVGILIIAASLFIPSLGGPVLAPPAAGRAAEALRPLAANTAIAPALREKIEQALLALRTPDVRQGTADEATAGIRRAMVEIEEGRLGVEQTLAASDNEELQRMVRAAARGDARAAAAAAAGLAERLNASPGSGGISSDQREHVTASLIGAAAAASRANLTELAARLKAASAYAKASADRSAATGTSASPAASATTVASASGSGGASATASDSAHTAAAPGSAEQPLAALSAAMTQALGPDASASSAAVAAAIDAARRAADLPRLPPPPAAALSGATGGLPASAVSPDATGGLPASVVGPGVTATGSASASAYAASPDVRPEDRDVVRKYFGG